jgi:hypothetical protein
MIRGQWVAFKLQTTTPGTKTCTVMRQVSILLVSLFIYMTMMRYIVGYVTNIITMSCIIVYDNGGVNIQYAC